MINKAKEILESVGKLLEEKNSCYGPGIFQADLFGNPPESAVLTRIGDKIRRLSNLYSSGEELTAGKSYKESIDDTIVDLIGYLAILSVIRRVKNGVYSSSETKNAA